MLSFQKNLRRSLLKVLKKLEILKYLTVSTESQVLKSAKNALLQKKIPSQTFTPGSCRVRSSYTLARPPAGT